MLRLCLLGKSRHQRMAVEDTAVFAEQGFVGVEPGLLLMQPLLAAAV